MVGGFFLFGSFFFLLPGLLASTKIDKVTKGEVQDLNHGWKDEGRKERRKGRTRAKRTKNKLACLAENSVKKKLSKKKKNCCGVLLSATRTTTSRMKYLSSTSGPEKVPNHQRWYAKCRNMYTLHTRFLHVWRRLVCSVGAH